MGQHWGALTPRAMAVVGAKPQGKGTPPTASKMAFGDRRPPTGVVVLLTPVCIVCASVLRSAASPLDASKPTSPVLRVAVIGTESTGKTTLTQCLAERFDEPWSEEFVREFWELKDGKITGEDLGTIALGQMANEDLALSQARRVVFFDTELVTCTLWDDVLFPGCCPPWVRIEADERARRIDLWLLCDTDVPFEPDPQRSFPDAAGRIRAREIWREAVLKRGLPFVEIQGPWAEREQRAAAAVQKLLDSARE
jgi:HTH-type transcriptional repressor of NAD biosynthesis genes